MNMFHGRRVTSSPHFSWGRSAWTLLFAWIALSVYAVWRLLATVLCQGASCRFPFSAIV